MLCKLLIQSSTACVSITVFSIAATLSICVAQVEDSLAKVRNAGTEQDLGIQYKALKPEVDKLNAMAAKRQQVIEKSDRQEQSYRICIIAWTRLEIFWVTSVLVTKNVLQTAQWQVTIKVLSEKETCPKICIKFSLLISIQVSEWFVFLKWL